jgi:hypothetical protein
VRSPASQLDGEANKNPGSAARKAGRSKPGAQHGLLASFLTWLQAGRPNDHDSAGLAGLDPRRQAFSLSPHRQDAAIVPVGQQHAD